MSYMASIAFMVAVGSTLLICGAVLLTIRFKGRRGKLSIVILSAVQLMQFIVQALQLQVSPEDLEDVECIGIHVSR